MIRSFLPVGQGGFAVEQFRNAEYNIVFDCGTTTKIDKKPAVKTIESIIRQTFDRNTRVQKVFVSHFHDDHINGLPFLLQYCHVEYIYLPYLTPSEQVIALILLHDSINDDNGTILQNLITRRPLFYNEIDTKTVYVISERMDMNTDNESKTETVYSGQEIKISDHNSPDSDEWIFIPFVYNDSERTSQFLKILNDCKIGPDIQEIILNDKFWLDISLKKIIRDAYKKIASDINLTTMVVWSGTKNKHTWQYPCKDNNCFHSHMKCRPDHYAPGCLYTGDYRASRTDEWDALRWAYDKVWEKTGVFTIPHHGSSNNYNQNMIEPYAAYIINAGYQNRYGHPHQKVLHHLIGCGIPYYWVNEFVGSQVIFKVSF